MNIPENIYLVGSMGAGKTTVGRQLAQSLGKRFLDSDKEIEGRTGVDIPLIFELEGEAGFRKRERRMIEELTAQKDLVLATGGGAVLDEENRSHLVGRGFVIYLCAPLELLVERTARSRNRPLLDNSDRRTRLQEILETRDPLYRQIADLTVESNHRSAHWMVRHILDALEAL